MTEATAAATTAATTANAADPAAAATTVVTATPPAFDWAQHGFAGDDLGYIQNKGFTSPKDAIVGYRNLESLVGADKNTVLRIPKEATPESMRSIYRQLGAPETADGYKLPLPEGGDDSLAKVARDWFFEAGATAKQAETIVSKLNEYVGQIETAKATANQAKAAEELTALKTEWGAAWEPNAALVDKAAAAFGMDEEQLLALRDSMGPAAAMKFLHNIGSKLGTEDNLPGNENKPGFAMTPQAALAKLEALKADPEWTKKFLAGGVAEQAESERLHKFAYQGS